MKQSIACGANIKNSLAGTQYGVQYKR